MRFKISEVTNRCNDEKSFPSTLWPSVPTQPQEAACYQILVSLQKFCMPIKACMIVELLPLNTDTRAHTDVHTHTE